MDSTATYNLLALKSEALAIKESQLILGVSLDFRVGYYYACAD
jgi:hypothetical protein